MGKLWLNNELVDRLAMLQQTETTHPGINQVAIEKDWWVTVTLKALFQTDCCESLIFKGGTSLSKGFNIIEHFSEDIDLSISHLFFGIEKTNKSQRDKLKKLARRYIQETLSTQLDVQLKDMGISGYIIENVTQVQDKSGGKETGIRSMLGETEQSAKNTPKTIYSINGCRIGNSTKGLSPGLYIVRQGNTSRKIIIKN